MRLRVTSGTKLRFLPRKITPSSQHLGFKEQSQSLCKRSRSNRELENISIGLCWLKFQGFKNYIWSYMSSWSYPNFNSFRENLRYQCVLLAIPLWRIAVSGTHCTQSRAQVVGIGMNWPCILSLLYKRRADQATKSIPWADGMAPCKGSWHASYWHIPNSGGSIAPSCYNFHLSWRECFVTKM